MEDKKSFYELLTGAYTGKWCEGLAMLDIGENDFSISNIYNRDGVEVLINGYSIKTKEKVFSKVEEMDYESAIKELINNKKTIISPSVKSEVIITFDGLKSINHGENVFSYSDNGIIFVNDKHKFDTFEEIINMGYISEEEKNKSWLVF